MMDRVIRLNLALGAQLRLSDPRITLRLYAHVVPQSQRDAVESALIRGVNIRNILFLVEVW
jgi:hypothetical protein